MIPTKIYDICAVGRPFISADTPAMREAFVHERNSWLISGRRTRRACSGNPGPQGKRRTSGRSRKKGQVGCLSSRVPVATHGDTQCSRRRDLVAIEILARKSQCAVQGALFSLVVRFPPGTYRSSR